jgi:hypothetical protein
VSKPQRAAGTYSVLDLLRHPSRIFRPASSAAGLMNPQAIRGGATLEVSCFLRGSFGAYPRGLKQGKLLLSGRRATWTPALSFKRQPLEINSTECSISIRPPDHREPNIKKGGTAFGVVAVPSFEVVTCNIVALGQLDLVVPKADAQLVADFFKNLAS